MSAAPATLLRHRGHLGPSQARNYLRFPLEVPAGAAALRIGLAFEPDRVGPIRNLLTISLFDPERFRGAAHRHDPAQTITVRADDASPGFIAAPLPAGTWLLEVDCHAVLPSLRLGLDFTVEASVDLDGGRPAASGGPPPGAGDLSDDLPPAAPIESVDGSGGAPAGIPPRSGALAEAGVGPGDAPAGWLKGDLHLHSNHSDGRWTVDDIARYAETNRLDFVALTDHNTISARAELQGALQRLGVATVLIPGMELTTFYGHANALGVEEWIDWRVAGPGAQAPARTMGEAAADVHRLGGTFVINHPRSRGYPACTGCRWEYGDESAAYGDVLEVMNGPWHRSQNEQALALWNRWLNGGRRLPAVAGSDAHGVAPRPEQLGFTFVHARRTPSSILEAVRAGRSFLSRGPALRWSLPAPEAGTAHQAPDARALPVAFRELRVCIEGLTAPAELRLVADGRPVWRQIVADDEVAVQPPGTGARWFRFDLYRSGSNELLALTNPVFTNPAFTAS